MYLVDLVLAVCWWGSDFVVAAPGAAFRAPSSAGTLITGRA